jgi:hypothetical protein
MSGGDNPRQWFLNSANGHRVLACEFVSEIGSTLVHEVRLSDDVLYVDIPARTTATVDRLALSAASLAALVDAVRQWLSLSLAELAATPFQYSCELCAEPGQSLSLEFGPRDDLTVQTRLGAVGCLIQLRVGLLTTGLRLVTDVTSLEVLATGIERQLQSPGRAAPRA